MNTPIKFCFNEGTKQKIFLTVEILAFVIGMAEMLWLAEGFDWRMYRHSTLNEIIELVFLSVSSTLPLVFSFILLKKTFNKEKRINSVLVVSALGLSPYLAYSLAAITITIGPFFIKLLMLKFNS